MIINSAPKILLDHDPELDILISRAQYHYFISLEDLLFIKSKLDNTIKFAQENNIKELNNAIKLEYEQDFIKDNSGMLVKRHSDFPTKVYLMKDEHSGLYKIGRSINPLKRERTLQSEKPQIRLIYSFNAYCKDEIDIHEKFKDKRVRGEWFSLNEDDINYIKNFLENEV